MTRAKALAASVAVTLVAALTGCSQVAAIAPVGGDRLAEVRYAAIDVIVGEGVDILAAPVCTTPDDIEVTCVGETVDGLEIRVSSTAEAPQDLVVVVGDRTVYSGSLMDVLEKGSSG